MLILYFLKIGQMHIVIIDTKLAKRISDEYSRSFSFSQKKQRGSTIINKISSNNIDKWSRSENEDSDIIKLFLKSP